MLKWAVTPRFNGDYFEHDGVHNGDGNELLTLQAVIKEHRLPCLVRLVNDDINEMIDNYCLLLCQTNDPYLLASNETERFSIPLSFDGMYLGEEKQARISRRNSKVLFFYICMLADSLTHTFRII